LKTKQQPKSKRLFQGMGIGYVICLFTHIIAALIPMYVVFPFAGHLFNQGHSHGHCHHYSAHSHGLLNHILGDILILTIVIIPVAALTWLGHRLVRYLRRKGSTVQEQNPCETCHHRK